MTRFPEYPKEVRERAIELYESNEELSYSQIAEKLKEEFKDVQGIESISKSTVYRWIKQYKKKKAKEEAKQKSPEEPPVEPEPEQPKEEPKPPKDSLEEIANEARELPKITPQQIVEELNESITPVEDGPLMKKAEQVEVEGEEQPEEKPKKLADILMENRNKILWSLTLTIITGVIIYLIYRWWTKKHRIEQYYYPQQMVQQAVQQAPQKPVPQENPNDYKQVVSPSQFEEPDDGFAGAEVLP